MSKIKNQNIFHLVDKTGKKTICGLSNQFSDALTPERFKAYLNDKTTAKLCCKKCCH